MKYLYNKKNLLHKLQNKRIAVYGAGNVSNKVISFLKRNNFEISCAIVTRAEDNPDKIQDISVCLIEEAVKEYSWDLILICTKECFHKNILLQIEKYITNVTPIYLIGHGLYAELELEEKNIALYNLVESLNNKLNCLENNYQKIENRLEKFIVRPGLEYLIVNILDHCNLKCRGCDHFACIADEYFVPIETIRSDIMRMSQLLEGDYVASIGVMGGEPLLHPQLIDILRIIRKAFPNSIIRLTTNGLLLLNQKSEFWECCRENHITIVNTKYPINLQFDKIADIANNYSVKYQFFEGTGDGIEKRSFKKKIDLDGRNDIVGSFAQCIISNYGNFLMEGKLYGCPFSCQAVRIFNKKFNQKLYLVDEDYLDIYNIDSKEQIFNFAAKPKYFCRYCSGTKENFPWGLSEKIINEWI